MENTEPTIIGYILGLYRDNGKDNGNYCLTIGYILGLYRDNGIENGDYTLQTNMEAQIAPF